MHNTFENLYDRLNPEQKKAVDTIDGPVFVMAGPGTGKTQILTLRIANILRHTDIDPENILALTFTNAAAYNMRERLSSIVGSEIAHRVYISTFHSFAEDMLRQHADIFQSVYGTRLLSPIEQIELLEHILDTMTGLEYFSVFRRREGTVRSIAFSIGKIKGEGMTANEFREHVQAQYDIDLESDAIRYKRKFKEFNAGDIKPTELRKLNQRRDKNFELATIYESYQSYLDKQKIYDFSDVMVNLIHELSQDHSMLKSELQEQFQYILVDEHQDTNDAQNTIVDHLIDNPVSEGKPNIFVVGDAKQAIFRFAGASENSYTRLLQRLNDPLVIHLATNYRSHQEVLSHSHALITHSEHHVDEQLLQAFFDYQGSIQYREFNDHKMEMIWLVQDIKSRIDNGENPNEIAVLYRNNADADDIRRLLDIYGIGYKDFSKKNILKDPDIQKLFYLLSAVHNPANNEIMAKLLFVDFLGCDVFEVQRILQKSRSARGEYHTAIMTILEHPQKLREAGITEERLDHYAQLVALLKKQKQSAENVDLISFFSDFVRESGFLKYILGRTQSVLALQKLEKLFDEIKKESQTRSGFTLADFIHYLNTMKKHGVTMNITNTLSDGVSLLTFHGSKGLEFDTVYMIKALAKRKIAREITLPFADFQDGESEDERRLFYVAITRARKNCLISSYVFNEEGREKTRSLHITEMNDIETVDMSDWEKDHAADVAILFNESQEHIVSLIDQSFIQERFLKNKLSVSALNNYAESPLKYFFRNLIYLPEARSPFLDKGNMLHETLEKYFNVCVEKQSIQDKEVLETCFQSIIKQNHHYQPYIDIAWNILSNYFDEYYETFEIPADNEKRISAIPFQLDNGQIINLTGVMDKITINEAGKITVWDYKTGRAYSDMDKGRKEKTKRQAAFYKLLLQNAFGGKFNFHTAIFDFLEPNSKGEYERAEFQIDQSDVDEVCIQINELANKIFDGTLLDGDFYRDPGNKELLEFLEVLRGPRTYEQLSLLGEE